MKKILTFIFLVSGSFWSVSSVYANGEEKEMSAPSMVETIAQTKENLVNDFNDFYRSYEEEIPCLTVLKKEVDFRQWVNKIFTDYAQIPGIGVSCFPNRYFVLSELIRDAATFIIKSDEYSWDNEVLFPLVENLDPAFRFMRYLATKVGMADQSDAEEVSDSGSE